MTDWTSRLALPLLAAGQAQKELFHNEALTALDALVQPVVETIGDVHPPAAPAPGRSWIVGTAPDGAWAGHADALATWTEGGWRFAVPFDGMSAWVRSSGLVARRVDGAWAEGRVAAAAAIVVGGDQVVGVRRAAIPVPAGGGVVDSEARAAIAAILEALRGHGLITG